MLEEQIEAVELENVERVRTTHHAEPLGARFGKHAMIRKLVLLAAVLALGACNTVSGVGRDVTSAGKAVTGAAKR